MKKILLFISLFVIVSCDKGDDGNQGVKEDANLLLDSVLNESFKKIVDVPKDSKTYRYLLELTEETLAQSEGWSRNGLPLLYKEENFPTVYNYYMGNISERRAVYKTMIGWLIAMQLSELRPFKRNTLYTAGYTAGGFTMNSPIYGYHFYSDPNVARLVASAVYSAMHTTAKPNIEAMRAEVKGDVYDYTLEQALKEQSRIRFYIQSFYVDLRKFMSSAPGPYDPSYADRGELNPTFPDEKATNGCLKVDMDIYNNVVAEMNLPNQRAVQAIADEDNDVHHLFGTDKRNVGGLYNFNAVFGESTIGETINPEGKIADFIYLVQRLGIHSRYILQHHDDAAGPYEYGRLRPGCSEQQQLRRKSFEDDRLNTLQNYIIENNDGYEVTFEEGINTPEEYENACKDALYAKSYPSGHSSGIWSVAMTLMELYPQKADLIMRAANDFALSRVVSRYHWNSDVIQGKVIGSVINPVFHATSDYNTLLEEARKEVR